MPCPHGYENADYCQRCQDEGSGRYARAQILGPLEQFAIKLGELTKTVETLTARVQDLERRLAPVEKWWDDETNRGDW